MAAHLGQFQRIQLVGQAGEGRGPRIVEMHSIQQGAVSQFAPHGVKPWFGEVKNAVFVYRAQPFFVGWDNAFHSVQDAIGALRQRNISRRAILGHWEMGKAPVKMDITPGQFADFSGPHGGFQGKTERCGNTVLQCP